MSRFCLRHPSPALVVSTIALIVALGGTSYAAFSLPKNSVGTKQLKNGAVTKAKLNVRGVTVPTALRAGSASTAANATNAINAVNATNATDATNATNATHASNSDLLAGSPPSAFFPASKVQTFNVKLAFGQTQMLFNAGTLTFSAKCVKNGTDPGGGTGRDFSELLVATSQNGGILTNGAGGGLHGTGPTDFLNINTTEANRAVAYVSASTGTSYGTIENNGSGYGMDVIDPNGVTVIFPDGLSGSVNLFGSNCLLAGFAIIP